MSGPDPSAAPNGRAHRGLKELFAYPLVSAIAERRTRRVAQGISIQAGPLSHQSSNEPAPLSKLEEAVLVVSTGVTGFVHHDGPLFTVKGTKELGTPFTNVIGRAASSADNAQATAFVMINDAGVWLIKAPKGRDALKLISGFPRDRKDWTENDWIAAADAVKVRLYEERLEFPRKFPYYHVWNKQMSNVPGTTLLMPIVDCTRGMLNIILNLLSEPDGERPTYVDDWQRFRPKNIAEFGAWVGSGLGLLDQEIPYQPIGGIKWARSGFTNPEIVIPIGLGHAWRLDYEALLPELCTAGCTGVHLRRPVPQGTIGGPPKTWGKKVGWRRFPLRQPTPRRSPKWLPNENSIAPQGPSNKAGARGPRGPIKSGLPRLITSAARI